MLEASVYGKCIVADYNSVYKDKCLTEFVALKNCYLVRDYMYCSPDLSLIHLQKAAGKKA